MKYLAQASNVYSQSGEDGIVEAILSSFPVRDRWCVEFGAWDGLHLSNSRRLIEREGYRAVLIEADPKLHARLVQNSRAFPGVVCLNAFVGFDERTSLDVLLKDTGCPADFDFLSIDIDGNDIHVWRAVAAHRPKLVCIEFNPTIPDGVLFEQPADPNVKWGSSLDAMKSLAHEKGYVLACANEANAFFVASEVWQKIPDAAARQSTTRLQAVAPVALFVGYDGSIHASADLHLVWHGVTAGADQLQIVPRFLRRFPPDYGPLQRLGYRLWSAWMRLAARHRGSRQGRRDEG
jgi:hypothetical protein